MVSDETTFNRIKLALEEREKAMARQSKTELENRSLILKSMLTRDAYHTIACVKRSFETDIEALNRLLSAMGGMAPDFDEFFGPPRDGKGPSGE